MAETFLYRFKNKKIYKFVKLRVQHKKVGQKLSFPPTFFCSCGSAIRDRKESIFGIWDKHPGSETLGLAETFSSFVFQYGILHTGTLRFTRTVFTVLQLIRIPIPIPSTDRIQESQIFDKNPKQKLLEEDSRLQLFVFYDNENGTKAFLSHLRIRIRTLLRSVMLLHEITLKNIQEQKLMA